MTSEQLSVKDDDKFVACVVQAVGLQGSVAMEVHEHTRTP